jgi:hypothetical protein
VSARSAKMRSAVSTTILSVKLRYLFRSFCNATCVDLDVQRVAGSGEERYPFAPKGVKSDQTSEKCRSLGGIRQTVGCLVSNVHATHASNSHVLIKDQGWSFASAARAIRLRNIGEGRYTELPIARSIPFICTHERGS